MTAPSIDQTPQGWDATVEDYERSLAPFFAQFAADALHLVGVQPGHRVLDVAAGPGTLALLAARRGATVVATDFAPGMVERLRQRAGEAGLTNLSAAVMDGQALTLPDNSFDAAFSNFGLIFFPDRAAGFRELYRVVRPGGKAAVSAWSTKVWNLAPILARAVGRALPAPPTPAAPRPALSLQDPEAFAGEMREAGFARVEIQTVVHQWELPTSEAVWEGLRSN
ncbi:MAG TPA: methyltransferase domain-containing protein, partial [Thermomicrobiales bacterium]